MVKKMLQGTSIKLLGAHEKEIDNNTNSLGITSKLGTMITGIATATNNLLVVS